MEQIWNTVKEFAITEGFRLVGAILLVIIGFKVTNMIFKRERKSKLASKIDPSAAGFLKSFICIVIKTLIVISAIAILGVPMSSIVAVLASAGVAIGLAVQGALSNLAGGIMILIFKPFKVGDYISSGDSAGTVRTIGVFYTELVTVDNKVITCPNGGLTNAVVVNYSQMDTRRVDITVSASYSNDTDKVKEALLALAKGTNNVLADPEPVVVLSAYADSSIDYTLRVWCKNGDYWGVYFDLTDRIKKVFDAVGIEIPYKQVDVHIKNQ